LLDYESQELIKANFATKTEGFLIREANNIRIIQNLQDKQISWDTLLKFNFDSSNNFYLNCNISQKENEDKNNYINWGNMSWFIVKFLKTTEGAAVI